MVDGLVFANENDVETKVAKFVDQLRHSELADEQWMETVEALVLPQLDIERD